MRTLLNDRTFTQPVVWVTSFFMVAFHIGAIAALFFFTWKGFFVAMFLWWVAGGARYRDGIPPPPHSSRLQDAQVGRICPHHLRHTRPRRRPHLLRRHPSHASPEHRQRRRSALSARRRPMVPCRLDPHRPEHSQRLCHPPPLRPRPSQRQIPRLAQPMALDSHDRPRRSPSRARRMVRFPLGHLLPHGLESSLHLAGQLRHPHVGLAPIPDRRHLPKQLLGCTAHLRRRMAQQPSRPSSVLPPRFGLV